METVEYSKVVSVVKSAGVLFGVTDSGDRIKLKQDPSTGRYVFLDGKHIEASTRFRVSGEVKDNE